MSPRFSSPHHQVKAAGIAKSHSAVPRTSVEASGETNAASGRTAIVTSVESLRSWMQAHRTLQILLVVVFGILLFSATADEPFQLDNMDFPAVARATSVSGVPVYYRGEENPRLTGLYHPPLYIYALATWIKMFGFGEVPVRMFGIA